MSSAETALVGIGMMFLSIANVLNADDGRDYAMRTTSNIRPRPSTSNTNANLPLNDNTTTTTATTTTTTPAIAITTATPTTTPIPTATPTATPTTTPTTTTTNIGKQLEEEAQKAAADDDKKDDSIFECNICLDTAKDAVVSMCGHLFCWPCLHTWLETRPTRKLCPVCKAAISKEKVIPLYGRDGGKQEDPRNKVPPRPAGQRTEPEPATGYQGFGFGDGGFHMSFGIGAFPFGYFASTFNIGEPNRTATTNQRAATQYEDEQELSRLFIYLAVICLGWLCYA